jgi:tetraacyldisaccharide 4'-kinase
MKIGTPDFWYKNSGSDLKSLTLSPFAKIYGAASVGLQKLQNSQKAGIPVICVGNITAGGSGKTPAAIMFAGLVKELELAKNPFFLSRGYGGNIKKGTMVDLTMHNHRQTGDEALMLAKHATVVIAPDRVKGARMAADHGSDFIIMDDGLQNASIHKDLSVVMISGLTGFGNGKTIPAGPLREPLSSGLEKADIFILVGEDKTGALKYLPENKPLVKTSLEAIHENSDIAGRNYIAFAGIAHPRNFFSRLESMGANLVGTRGFPDHHPYSEKEISSLWRQAGKSNAGLITTEKDFARLGNLPSGKKPEVLRIKMSLDEENRNKLENILVSRFRAK